jgi:RsiW-degrading membrane proteinase PrsW (M82 family)
MDGIVYTIVASLGFACLENIMYVSEGGMTIALIRSVTAVPLHAFCSGIMGYYIGKAKFSKTNSKKYILEGLFYAVCIHGFYNFVLFIGGIYSFIIIPILIISYKKLKLYIDDAIKEDLKK